MFIFFRDNRKFKWSPLQRGGTLVWSLFKKQNLKQSFVLQSCSKALSSSCERKSVLATSHNNLGSLWQIQRYIQVSGSSKRLKCKDCNFLHRWVDWKSLFAMFATLANLLNQNQRTGKSQIHL